GLNSKINLITFGLRYAYNLDFTDSSYDDDLKSVVSTEVALLFLIQPNYFGCSILSENELLGQLLKQNFSLRLC
ncbi:MAG: hypothetical protein D6772_07120, partial [Bacteroidetes bacterium]